MSTSRPPSPSPYSGLAPIHLPQPTYNPHQSPLLKERHPHGTILVLLGDVGPEEATRRATALLAHLKGVDDWRPRLVSALLEVPDLSATAGSMTAARTALLQPFEANGATSLMVSTSQLDLIACTLLLSKPVCS